MLHVLVTEIKANARVLSHLGVYKRFPPLFGQSLVAIIRVVRSEARDNYTCTSGTAPSFGLSSLFQPDATSLDPKNVIAEGQVG